MKTWLPWILLIGCGSSQPPAIPPGTLVTPPDPPAKKKPGVAVKPAVMDAGPPPAPANPVNASFMDLTKDKKRIDHVACEFRALAVVKGKANAAGENLAQGDILVAQGKGGWDVTGEGLAVFAIINTPQCEPNQYTTITKKVIRGSATPVQSWAGGTMKAWLDVEGANAPVAYMGRLEGTGAVAEHAHETSWEVLCAVEGKGTLTLAGAPQAVAAKTCTAVPPNTKHAWAPDAGTKLVAIQLYAPPGPEQRFKAMAAADKADAGPPKVADAGAVTAAKPDSGATPAKR